MRRNDKPPTPQRGHTSLTNVYQQVVATLTSHFEIEVSVLQALSYCFYEILDNVHIHSGKPLGTAITHFDADKAVLRVLVADDGMGIQKSLSENETFAHVTEAESLDDLKRHTSFWGLSTMAERSILVALQRRYTNRG